VPSLTIGFRRAEVTAFWVLTGAVLSLLVGLVATALGTRAPWAWSAGGLVVFLPGLVWPLWFEIGVRAWNKGVRVCSAVLRAYTLRIAYVVLFRALGRSAASFDVISTTRGRSAWQARAEVDRGPASDWGSRTELLRFTRTPGHAWAIVLLPFLQLLTWLGEERQQSTPSSSSYTLY
jgi:hypothetical protein